MAYKTLNDLKKKSKIVEEATESEEQKFRYFQNPERFKPLKANKTTRSGSTVTEKKVTAEKKNQVSDPVRVTDYAAPAGLGSVSYSDSGKVSVGGVNIPVLYMDGDRAVVERKDLDNAYENLKTRLGIKSGEELTRDWESQYGSKVSKAYDEMSGYGKWEYSLENDPAYQAYRDMYVREGQRAYRDAAAGLASKNNGNMTSAAQTVANQQLLYYMNMLSDKIPELQKNAYERYKSGYDMKANNFSAIQNAAKEAWERSVRANEIAKEDYYTQRENERQRTLDAQADRMAELEEEGKRAENTADRFNNSWENAERRGYFTDDEGALWSIPKKDDGSYMTPNEIKIDNELKYFKEVLIPQLDYEAMLELNYMIEQMAQKNSYEAEKAARDHAYDKKLAAYKAYLK